MKIWQTCHGTLQLAGLAGCPHLLDEGRDYHVEPLAEPLIHATNVVAIPREQSTIYHINVESDLWLACTRVWPYQQAVMFLGTNPWRALFCGLCGRRFVADKPGRRFCSETCTKEARKRGQLAWWNQHGENWRNGKTKQKGTKKSSKKGKR